MKFESKYKTFHSSKCIWKCHLRNGGHFVQGEMCCSGGNLHLPGPTGVWFKMSWCHISLQIPIDEIKGSSIISTLWISIGLKNLFFESGLYFFTFLLILPSNMLLGFHLRAISQDSSTHELNSSITSVQRLLYKKYYTSQGPTICLSAR